MASITSAGIGSGIDINGLVTQLVTAERQPVAARFNQREAALQTRISALGSFKSALSQFQSALSGLKNADTFKSGASATSGNEKLFTATASAGAPAGSYSVTVEQLAQSQRLATDANHRFQSLTDVVGTGTLTFQFGTYGGTAGSPTFTANPDKAVKTVTIDASNNTLSGVAKAINDAKIGVQASVINDGGGYRLVLGSTATGAANNLKITVADGDSNSTDMAGLSLLAHDPTLVDGAAGKNLTQTVAGQDARAIIDGLTVTGASNTLSQAIPGVTLTLKSKDTAPATLTVAQNNGAIGDGIESFVKAYNELASTVKALTSYDAETKRGGALQGDFSVRAIFGQLRSELNKAVKGASSQFDSLADLGITTQRDGTIALDSAKLQKAIETDAQGVANLFARAGRATDPQANYVGATSDSKAGDYGLTVSQLATQGSYTGTAVAAGSFAIDGGNNTFALKVNGTQSGTITLTQGTFTSVQLAAELQSRINGDSALQAASASVSVSFSATASQFAFTSATYGAASNVEFTAVGASTQATLGFGVGAGTAGQDVRGTLGDNPATGAGRKLTGSEGGAKGISVEVLGGVVGDRGKVSLSDGLAQRLDNLLSDLLGGDGPLSDRIDNLSKQVDRIDDQRKTLDDRMTALEKRYRAQFTAMDKLVSQLTATGNYLTQQFKSMSASNS